MQRHLTAARALQRGEGSTIREDKGFTLIELMVVVLIIGILVGIAALSLNGAQTSSRNRSAQANLRNVQTALSVAAANSVTTNDAAAANGQEAGLVNVGTGPSTGRPQQAYSNVAGVFCANGNVTGGVTTVFIVQSSGTAYARTQGTACPATLASPLPASTW